MVTINYGNSMSRIMGGLLPRVTEQLSLALSYDIPNADRTNAYLKGWDGRIRLFHKGNKSFPSGLLYLVENILQENDVDYLIEGRIFPDIQGYIDVEKTTLRDYQLRAVVDAIEAGRGLIRFPVGSGKSKIATGIVSLIGRKALIVVHRKEILDQMIEHCEETGLKVGRIQGSTSVRFFHSMDWNRDVFCAMFQTLNQVRLKDLDTFNDFTKQIGCFVIDEVHRAGAKTFYNTMLAFSSTSYRFGMSGTTEGRADNADLLLRALTGDIVAKGEEAELMKEGWISIPIVYMIEVESPHHSRYEWHSVYREGIVHNSIRNNRIKDSAIQLIKQGRMVLILCNYIEHGMMLKELINKELIGLPHVEFIHGSTPKGLRDGELNRFRRADTVCLIMSDIGSEGVDIPACDALINTAAGMSHIKVLQRAGRAMRPKKDGSQAIIIDFIDNDSSYGMLLRHSKSRMWSYNSRGFQIRRG